MFTKLRNIIANALAVKQSVQVRAVMETTGNGSLTYGTIPEHIRTQNTRAAMPAIKGEFSIADLEDLGSERLRDAICSLGCWSAIARAFNQFNRQAGMTISRQNYNTMYNLIEEFHTWNSHSFNQMDEDATLAVIAKLTDVTIPKGNAQTDAIIARVRKVSVEDVKAERIEKALKKQRVQEGHVEAFNSQLWASAQGENENFSMPIAKAVMKAIQTMEWIAGWDAFDPNTQAAELLLIEADIKYLEKLGKSANDNGEKFIDGTLTSDGMMNRYA